MSMEKELEKMIRDADLPKLDEQQEAVKKLPPRWVAITPNTFNQVAEETKIIRKYVPTEKKNKYES
ncbi:MAG TPA: hypothetical protein VJ824_06210 [Bacillota bacterium]|nr:hypothetical protein [Bacillota bacterium]